MVFTTLKNKYYPCILYFYPIFAPRKLLAHRCKSIKVTKQYYSDK